MRYIVFEGLPAVGKSETLSLLARFYPQRVKVLPELVKEVVLHEGIDLFTERDRLTAAIIAALPRRRKEIEQALADGKLCLEESHLGVHLAYAKALNDDGFIASYPQIANALPAPDCYLRMEIPVEVSLSRQRERGTPEFAIERQNLETMLAHLQEWHIEHGSELVTIDADREPSTFLMEIEKSLGLAYTGDWASLEDTFDIILLLGRPASGKSEFIDFMYKDSRVHRAERYHIAPFHVIDDFPVLWEKFEEDDLWEELGRDRLYSRRADENYAITDHGLWSFLIGKINQQVAEIISDPNALSHNSLIVEFSRGGEDGYVEALSRISPAILSRAAILYVDVPFEESWRRNLARYDETRKNGILTHSVPRIEMQETYGIDDWFKIAPDPYGMLSVNGISVPYATMCNEPESTDPVVLDRRYNASLNALHEVWSKNGASERQERPNRKRRKGRREVSWTG